MKRTKETLEARVRETPLVDRLKECQQRIGNMCAELRGPKMSIPVEYYDDDFYICTTLADAQATVEALQAQITALTTYPTHSVLTPANYIRHAKTTKKSSRHDCPVCRDCGLPWPCHAYELEQELKAVYAQLTQRTAELEAIEKILDINSGKTTVEKVRDLRHSFKQVWESYQDASNEMFKAQAALTATSQEPTA